MGGIPRPNIPTDPWYCRSTPIYLSVLLGTGVALGLNRLSTLDWAYRWAKLSGSGESISQLLALILVLVSVVASAFGVMDSTQGKPPAPPMPIRSENRFLCTVAIMLIYLLEFSYFPDVSFVVILTAVVWVLFVGWDYLKSLEKHPDGSPYSAGYPGGWRDYLSILWAIVFIGLAALFLTCHNQSVQIPILLIAIGLTLAYRYAKSRFPKTSDGNQSRSPDSKVDPPCQPSPNQAPPGGVSPTKPAS